MTIPTKKPTIRAAIYARYSSDLQNPKSADDQIMRIRHNVERETLSLVRFPLATYQVSFDEDWIVKDEAKTGRTANRKGYEKILAGIRGGSFDVLFVDDLSRLTRELGNLIDLYQLINFHQIELYSLCDGISSETPDAKTHFVFKGLTNEASNTTHGRRTKRGQESRVLSGFSTGDICYGYRSRPTAVRFSGGREVPSHYEIYVEHQEAEIINLIFDLKIKKIWMAGPFNRVLVNSLSMTRRIV